MLIDKAENISQELTICRNIYIYIYNNFPLHELCSKQYCIAILLSITNNGELLNIIISRTHDTYLREATHKFRVSYFTCNFTIVSF